MADILYAYVDGSDLDHVQGVLAERFACFTEHWTSFGACFVDDRHERTPELQPDELPDWFLGLNVPLDKLGETEADELLLFLRDLSRATGRDFVIGIGTEDGADEDVLYVDSHSGSRERDVMRTHVLGL